MDTSDTGYGNAGVLSVYGISAQCRQRAQRDRSVQEPWRKLVADIRYVCRRVGHTRYCNACGRTVYRTGTVSVPRCIERISGVCKPYRNCRKDNRHQRTVCASCGSGILPYYDDTDHSRVKAYYSTVQAEQDKGREDVAVGKVRRRYCASCCGVRLPLLLHN